VRRHATNFVDDFITIADGRTNIVRNGVTLGAFDNAVYRNTNLPKRDYKAVEFQSAYRLGSHLAVNGQWTLQVRNDGTFEGESTSGPALPSLIGDYPEIYVAARSFPDGRVDDFQRHKVRVWASYGVQLGRFGRVDVAPQRGLNVLVLDGRGRYTRAGAEVRVYRAGTRTLIGTRMVDTGSGYCSQNMMAVHVGLPTADAVDVEVTTFTSSGKKVTKAANVDPRTLNGKPLVVTTP